MIDSTSNPSANEGRGKQYNVVKTGGRNQDGNKHVQDAKAPHKSADVSQNSHWTKPTQVPGPTNSPAPGTGSTNTGMTGNSQNSADNDM